MNWMRSILVGVLLLSVQAFAWGGEQWATTPSDNDGQPWQIAFYEGGDYPDYRKVLVATVEGLMELGWIEHQTLPDPHNHDSKYLWDWLAKNVRSRYVNFREDAYYTAGWDVYQRAVNKREIIRRLNHEADIDMVLAMGTWAGQDLANPRHDTPTFVQTASNPITAGIIKSSTESGHDHIHATVDPSLQARQIRIFHELVGFKKLGIAYEDTISGRSYAAVDQAIQLGFELGFEVVPCFTKSDVSDQSEAEKSVIACMKTLVESVDGIYITVQGGVTKKSLSDVVAIALEGGVATFSQGGSADVRAGILFSLAQDDFSDVGLFEAKNIAKVFRGAKPGLLRQVFEAPPRIAVNTKTAEVIGYDPPLLLLGAADEVYEEFE